MLRQFLLFLLLAAMVNVALFVPQYNLTDDECASATNTIDESDCTVESILTTICEEIFDVEYAPINEDAHFLEQDCIAKRLINERIDDFLPISSNIFSKAYFIANHPNHIISQADDILQRAFSFVVRLTPF